MLQPEWHLIGEAENTCLSNGWGDLTGPGKVLAHEVLIC